MANRDRLKETDIAEKVINWLTDQHWDIYQEVQFRNYGRIADIVAVRAGYVWIIECKSAMTFTVLEQAHRWLSHFRSVAIPHARNSEDRQFAYLIARNYLELGVIELNPNYDSGINEVWEPPLIRGNHRIAKWMITQLKPEQKYYLKAGSNGGGHYTPYRGTMDQVKRIIRENPGCSLKFIMDHLKDHHYSTDATARSCIRVALANWESEWCDVTKNGRGEFLYSIKGESYKAESLDIYPLFAHK